MANSNIKNVQTAGFYYDAQLSNPLLTATLHTNTYISNWIQNPLNEDPYEIGEQFKWELWNPVSKEKENIAMGAVECLEKITDNYSDAYPRNPSACYRKKPLISAILNEDFMIQIGNSWGDAGGMTQLEQTFNNLKATAAYSKEVGAGIQSISEALETSLGGKQGPLSNAVNWVNKNVLSKVTGDGKSTDRLNRALITQGSRFSYYGGTQTTFQNLTMRFTVFADWVYDERVGDVIFKTVHEQLRDIYPYAIGKYDPVDASGTINKLIKPNTPNWVAKSLNKTDDVISTFFGWQSPPGGFQADVRSLDTCQKGTLRLILGGYYTAENLLIDGMSVNFSKTMTKIPPKVKKLRTDVDFKIKKEFELYTDERAGIEYELDDEGNVVGYSYLGQEIITTEYNYNYSTKLNTEGGLTPLYADVTINLRPATNYSDNAIIHFSSNKGLGKVNQEIAKLRNDKLEKEVKKKKEAESQENIDYKKRLDAQKEFYLKYETEEEIEDEILHVDKVEVEGNPNYKEDLSWGEEMINNLNNSVLSERTQIAKELGEYYQQVGNKANAGIGGNRPPIL